MAPSPAKTGFRPLDPLWRVLRGLRALVSVLLYWVIAPTGILPFALFQLFCRGDRFERARVLQRTSARGVRIMHAWLRLTRIVRFDWRDVRIELPPGPCVIVANHPTQLDPTLLIALFVEACTLVKPSIYRNFLLHRFLADAMHFEGPSPDPTSVGAVVEEAVARLDAGMHLFVFPEAKRSPQGELRAFGRIAFEIACRADVPVVSLAIRCEPCYLSRETPLLWPPARLPRVFVERLAVDLPGENAHDSRAMKDRAEARYRAWVAAGMPALGAVTDARPSLSSMCPPTGS